MEIPGRRYLCAGCRKAVVICRYCDRGNRYCDRACSQAARQRHQHAAGQRFQSTRRGRHAHAERQRRDRARKQKVTHQGSPPEAAPDLLAAEPTVPGSASFWACCRCQRHLPDGVRQDFLRCRSRQFRPNRSTHGPFPRN